MSDALRKQKNRILWKCRQGTRELELVLCSFAEFHYDSLSLKDRHNFDRFLDFSSADLTSWLLLGSDTYAECFAELVEQIRSFKLVSNN